MGPDIVAEHVLFFDNCPVAVRDLPDGFRSERAVLAGVGALQGHDLVLGVITGSAGFDDRDAARAGEDERCRTVFAFDDGQVAGPGRDLLAGADVERAVGLSLGSCETAAQTPVIGDVVARLRLRLRVEIERLVEHIVEIHLDLVRGTGRELTSDTRTCWLSVPAHAPRVSGEPERSSSRSTKTGDETVEYPLR